MASSTSFTATLGEGAPRDGENDVQGVLADQRTGVSCALCSLDDQIDDGVGPRDIYGVASANLDDSCSCTLRHRALRGRRYHAVLRSHQVPARLGFPGWL